MTPSFLHRLPPSATTQPSPSLRGPLRGLLLASLLSMAAGGCALTGAPAPGVLVETAAHGQPLAGVACTAVIGEMRWDVVTPAVIDTGDARGELRVVCNQTGYRTSELIFRPVSGIGLGVEPAPFGPRYPKRVTLDMNPP